MSENCFHCGEDVPPDSHWTVSWHDIEQPMCCPGCQAVCETIIAGGLDEYYQLREKNPLKPASLIPDELKRIESYNKQTISQAYLFNAENTQSANFYISGMTCAACAWLIEKQVARLPFVENISVNAVSNLAQISWYKNNDQQNSHLGDIIKKIKSTGYNAKPLLPEQLANAHALEQKAILKRLGVAGLGMMQVMMFAVGLYTGAFQGMEAKYQTLLRWVSLLVATPVIFYSAAPFFQVAWHNIKSFKFGMNVPVAIAIGAAYSVSCFDTLTGQGEVYFDSAVMFTFFLLIGRFLQSRARWRASETNLSTSILIAPTVQVKNNFSQDEDCWEFKAVSEVKSGDRILVAPGETVPVDGYIEKGKSEVSTAVINGEFSAHLLQAGDKILAGSINQSQPLEIVSTAVGSDRFIEKLAQQQQQALSSKPKIISMADEFAHWFVILVLLAATATAIYWVNTAPENAFWITLSVLVVTCPCALSLATPASITAAIGKATKFGLLISNPELLEKLPHCQWAVFDKTGTLTLGKLQLDNIELLDENYSTDTILKIATALEKGFNHPVAKALLDSSTTPLISSVLNQDKQLTAVELENIPGKGISGKINKTLYHLGQFNEFLPDKNKSNQPDDSSLKHSSKKVIYLFQSSVAIAKLIFKDPWRSDALETIDALKNNAFKIAILTGDPSLDSQAIKRQFNADEVVSGCSAKDKLNWVKQQQLQGNPVLMLGDGLNDAPVLAQADVSIAMAESVSLSRTGSDATLLNPYLCTVVKLLNLAKKTRRVIKQNLIWAIVYNATTIPLAAMGDIPPWLAAIGMSLSSLFVVLNALRLNTSTHALTIKGMSTSSEQAIG
ncbi:MAG TPA: heavy metal translocating P-type ATPase [Aeromonadales bacterium]|nr:heavy metal translocating P-type ATPase [Aeromonadales bacterium]